MMPELESDYPGAAVSSPGLSVSGRLLKRAFDFSASLLGLILVAPLLALIALVIRLDSPGPVFYRARRAGPDGKEFRIWKFRTMVVDAEALGGRVSPAGDPRITNAGDFLRKYKLDELPQLINVLSGDMSLVGPRPEAVELLSMYGEPTKKVLRTRPGITDWASIWAVDEGAALAGPEPAEEVYRKYILPRKVRLQIYYLETQSLWNDFRIIIYTVWKILFRDWVPAELRQLDIEPNGGQRDSRAEAAKK